MADPDYRLAALWLAGYLTGYLPKHDNARTADDWLALALDRVAEIPQNQENYMRSLQ